MPKAINAAIAKIHSIADQYCEIQMYCWPGFDPMHPDPIAFFEQQGVEFDGEFFVRFPVKRTFKPIPIEQLTEEERALGIALPDDYKILLNCLGAIHLPGRAAIAIESPLEAAKTTAQSWRCEGSSLSALAISTYNNTSDGNSIGFIRQGVSFDPALYEFDHELRYKGDDPRLWTRKASDCLADFLVEYLNR